MWVALKSTEYIIHGRCVCVFQTTSALYGDCRVVVQESCYITEMITRRYGSPDEIAQLVLKPSFLGFSELA